MSYLTLFEDIFHISFPKKEKPINKEPKNAGQSTLYQLLLLSTSLLKNYTTCPTSIQDI
jgi:hypothetical protein